MKALEYFDIGYNMMLIEISKLGPTAMPTLFSAVVTDTLGLLARLRSQKGGRLQIHISYHNVHHTSIINSADYGWYLEYRNAHQ